MSFAKLQQARVVPVDATAVYVFDQLEAGPSGMPPSVTLRHAGDGTPAFAQASWHHANATRTRVHMTRNAANARRSAIEDAKLIADYCIVAWTDVIDDAGMPAPCSPEVCLEFLAAIIESVDGLQIYNRFSAFAGDSANFRPVHIANVADLGKR